MSSSITLACSALVFCLTTGVFVPAAAAQNLPQMEMSLSTEQFIDPPSYVQMVPAKGLSQVYVSDPAGKLILTQNDELPQIMLVGLSATGQWIDKAKATGFSLPGNTDKKIVNNVLAIATHPSLPVMYVWQDTGVNRNAVKKPVGEAEVKYSHLLIYDISKPKPELLMTTCSGEDFMIGRGTGILSLGNQGKRLFVPNLRYKVSRGYGVAQGYYALNDKGLPILTGADPEADPAMVSGSSDENDQPEDQSQAHVPDENEAQKISSGRGGGLTMLHLSNLGSRFAAGHAIYIDDAHTLLRSANFLLTYDSSNRSGRIAGVIMPAAHSSYSKLVPNESTRTPSFLMVYNSSLNASNIIAWATFQGYPSLMPQNISVAPLGIYCRTTVVSKAQKLAVGSSGRVLLISLDKQGWFTPVIEQFKVPTIRVSLMVYSEKFDRLYVGTGEPLEVAP